MKKFILLIVIIAILVTLLCACTNSSASNEEKNIINTSSITNIIKVNKIDELKWNEIIQISPHSGNNTYPTKDKDYIKNLREIIGKAEINNEDKFPIPKEGTFYPKFIQIKTYSDKRKMYTFEMCGFAGDMKLHIEGYGLNFYCNLSDEAAEALDALYEDIINNVSAST